MNQLFGRHEQNLPVLIPDLTHVGVDVVPPPVTKIGQQDTSATQVDDKVLSIVKHNKRSCLPFLTDCISLQQLLKKQ